MSKRKLFIEDDDSPLFNLSGMHRTSPPRGGVHPALLNTSNLAQNRKKKRNSLKWVLKENTKEIRKEPNHDSVNINSGKISACPSRIQPFKNDSESDPLEVPGFFSSSNQKLPYSKEEDELILKYVLKGQNIFKVCSLSLWKHLEAKKENPRRTYQSLKNRFLRNIKPFIFSRFGHLVTDDVKEKILLKFPEMKQKIARKETLSRIKLPERKPAAKVQEEDRVTSTSTNESRTEKTDLGPDSDGILDCAAQPESGLEVEPRAQREIPSDWYKPEVYQRDIKLNKEGIVVCVNLKSKRRVGNPTLGIYEKFKVFEATNKLVFCPTCGRFNLPKNVSPLKCSRETDVIIPNSLDTPRTPSKNLKPLSSTSKHGVLEKRRRINSGSQRRPWSPSLLNDEREVGANEIGLDMATGSSAMDQLAQGSRPRKNINELKSRNRVQQKPNSVFSEKENVHAQAVPNTRLRVKKASNPTSDSSVDAKRSKTAKASGTKAQKGDEASAKSKDSDEDLESICEEAMAKLRKLISDEEEKLLVRKCLNKNFKSIGLEAVSQSNWDSYFLESSSDLGTPPLTIDYETDTQNNERETPAESTLDTPLFKNMKKMLEEK